MPAHPYPPPADSTSSAEATAADEWVSSAESLERMRPERFARNLAGSRNRQIAATGELSDEQEHAIVERCERDINFLISIERGSDDELAALASRSGAVARFSARRGDPSKPPYAFFDADGTLLATAASWVESDHLLRVARERWAIGERARHHSTPRVAPKGPRL